MDEEVSIVDSRTRGERIKKFFIDYKKIIISLVSLVFVVLIGFYAYQIYLSEKKEKISNKYNNLIINYKNNNISNLAESMKKIVNTKDNTYSLLALYFLIDNNLIEDKQEINDLFDIVINKISLEKEIKNLVIYKKALFNADSINENDLLSMLKPLLNSESIWKSHAMYLIAEYFYSKNEKQKSKEFFEKIIILENANADIIKEAQKRLSRDLSE
tara:strand:+ start:1422 stop:2066 length:645 start_codon:yes stop_codon:yes gene_type:complete